MINVEILDIYTSDMELHPQVLIKLKQHALGNHLSTGLNFSEEKTTEDYYEDAALIFDHMSQMVDSLTSEEQFEEIWMNFTGTEPVKWQPFENYTWEKLWQLIIEDYENLIDLTKTAIALQNLGPAQGLFKNV